MGVSMTVHVGPFVRIKLEPTTYISNVKCCTNEGCKQHKRASIEKFCRDCGTKIEVTGVELTGTIGWQEFLPLKDYEYEDELYAPEYLCREGEEVLLSNYNGTCVDDNGGIVTLATVGLDNLLIPEDGKVDADMAKFYVRHGTMLEEMVAVFGDKMSIEYGVCSYWS